jgi:hypothetical protein
LEDKPRVVNSLPPRASPPQQAEVKKSLHESECQRLTKDVAEKLLEALKHQTSEEAAQGLIYQALGYFRQNYDQILAA